VIAVSPVTGAGAAVYARRIIRVATYNIHLGIGSDGHFSPERTAGVIHDLDADIIALQEIALSGPPFNMLEYLRQTSGLYAIAGPTLKTTNGDYGNAILTRYRIIDVQRLDLSFRRREPRAALAVRLDCDGQPLRVIATHLGLRPAERRYQIRKLLSILPAVEAVPAVLLGDLNEWFLWGRPLRWLHRHFKQTPAPATFPARWPLFALDRVWVEPRRALKRVSVHASKMAHAASDHLPLIATLDLGGDNSTIDHFPIDALPRHRKP